IPRTLADLLEQTVLIREMLAGRVEECKVPTNCLDILAQQIIAMVAVTPWQVQDLLNLIRQAYPYRDLSEQVLETVLEMVTGRYRFQNQENGSDLPTRPGHTLNALQPRISWDRIHNRLLPLPGSKQIALLHGGTIPDTGQYAAYTLTGVRIGELDEEFVFERRVGEAFMLGTNTWRVEKIEADRVLVSAAEGENAVLPFWRGEGGGRSFDFGRAIGTFLREMENRLHEEDCQKWLEETFNLESSAARNLRWHILRQKQRGGCLPTDKTLYLEASRDQLGDWQIFLLSPLGRQIHLALRLAIETRLKQRLGYKPQCLHHDDGVLIRLTDSEEPVLDVLAGLSPENIRDLMMEELIDSPLFALRFRQNAARALLLPTGGAGKRAPLWLQRLRGRDLLQVARRHPDFPMVVETFRECLNDYLDLQNVQNLLRDIQSGNVTIIARQVESPSPFASGLLFAFTAGNMYQFDSVEGETSQSHHIDRNLLDQLLGQTGKHALLDPRAIVQVNRRLRGLGHLPRSSTEMAEWLRKLGDLPSSEVEGVMAGYLEELQQEGRAVLLKLPGLEPGCNQRWILAEELASYEKAFGMVVVPTEERQKEAEIILNRFLNTHALVCLQEVLSAYPFAEEWATRKMEEWARQGRAVRIDPGQTGESMQWSAPDNYQQVQRTTLGLLRREVLTAPSHQFADYLLRWHGLQSGNQTGQERGVEGVLECLEGLALPGAFWEEWIFPSRIPHYQNLCLDEILARGGWLWACPNKNSGELEVVFLNRQTLPETNPPPHLLDIDLEPSATRVLEVLQLRGASFASEVRAETGMPSTTVRSALWNLLCHGLITNDLFDVVRQG
ncbi:MAG: hypothetical protein AB7P49_21560, partial [Bdellovibrionales bacterium]